MTPSLNSIMSRLHIKQLRLLIALDEHGSLLGAAKQVALTQPGASKALQEIETTFGTSLFTRTNRGLEPNDAGRSVIRYARLIQTDLAHLREEIIGIMSGEGGRVSVGTIMGAVPFTDHGDQPGDRRPPEDVHRDRRRHQRRAAQPARCRAPGPGDLPHDRQHHAVPV